MSLTASGSLSPSLISASPIAFRLACCTSLCLAQMIFPLVSIDMAGSSRPTYTEQGWKAKQKDGKWNKLWKFCKAKYLQISNVTSSNKNVFLNVALSLAHLDNDAAFIIAQRHIVGAPEAAHAPHSLHAIVQSALQAVSAWVPDPHRTYKGRR